MCRGVKSPYWKWRRNVVTKGTTTLLKTKITRITGNTISPNPARILITRKKTMIPKRNRTVLPADLLLKNKDIRIHKTNRFIKIAYGS